MDVKWLPIGEVKPYPHNPRKRGDLSVKKIADSLKEFGWQQPIVVDSERVIIVGHGRHDAARLLGMPQVPVVVADKLTPDQARAYRIADNRTNSETEWDDDLLKLELVALVGTDYELKHTELDQDEIDALLADIMPTDGLVDEDQAPDPPELAVSVAGDLWQLGRHILACGDATDQTVVDRLLSGAKVQLVFTDPPYGVKFQSGMAQGGTASRFDVLQNDDKILDIASVIYAAMDVDAAAFIWTSHHVYPQWREQFSSFYKQTIIWYKHGGGIGDLSGAYATDFEMALFCVRGRPTFRGKRGMAVWSISKDSANSYVHPTQKPVALAELAMTDFTDNGRLVLDLFGGSGSTLIACEKLGRTGRIMELDPKYCDVIIRRWQNFTGKQAKLEGDTRTFAEIEKERIAATV